MADAPRDSNYNPTLLAVSNSDGVTPIPLRVNPTTHRLLLSNGTIGSDLSGDNASRDNNYVPTLLGVSNSDGSTTAPLYADPSNGKLLVQST